MAFKVPAVVINLDGEILLYHYDHKPDDDNITKITHPINSIFVKVCKGNGFIVALDSDGHIWTDYNNNSKSSISIKTYYMRKKTGGGELYQMNPDITFVDISCGDWFFVALDSLGNIWSCGSNYWGQLGIGVKNDKVDTLTQVQTETKFISVACGNTHMLAIDGDSPKKLWGCGSNYLRELGIQTKNEKISNIINIPTHFKPKKICGCHFSLILDTNGKMWVFGGEKKIKFIKMPIEIQDVSCGFNKIIALDISGNVWNIKLENLSITSCFSDKFEYSLEQLDIPTKIVSLFCDIDYMSALDENGNLWISEDFENPKFFKSLNNIFLLENQKLSTTNIKSALS